MSIILNNSFDLGNLSLCQMSYKSKLSKRFWSKLSSDFIQNQNRGKILKCQKYGITLNLNSAVSVCVKYHTEKKWWDSSYRQPWPRGVFEPWTPSGLHSGPWDPSLSHNAPDVCYVTDVANFSKDDPFIRWMCDFSTMLYIVISY